MQIICFVPSSTTLSVSHHTPQQVPEKKKLGEWVGLAKFDREANIKKVIGASCVAVTDYGEKSKALDMILGHFRN